MSGNGEFKAVPTEMFQPLMPLSQSQPSDRPDGNGKADVGNFGYLALGWQALMLPLLYFVDYNTENFKVVQSTSIYNLYVGVALMMFVGFGYLMSFLRGYGLGAVGFTMFITCAGVEWALIIENMMRDGLDVKVEMIDFLNANTAVAAVLISFGGLIGKISPTQVIVVTFLELIFYCINKVFFLEGFLDIADCGGTIIIHVFGAYFGLAACYTLGGAKNETLNGPSYISDLFSLIGTVFLWLFWPSFVAGLVPAGTDGHAYALLNTVLALLGSTVVTFGLVPFLNKGRLAPVPIQNATLAGGVAIGATANLPMGPLSAVLVGCVAGLISCTGFQKPLLPTSLDTCGINNLHGMPGIFGALFSALIPLWLSSSDVGKPGNQIAGLVGTLVVSIATGALTGFILKMVGSPVAAFNDESFWECEAVEVEEKNH